ncbi:MAG TPA: UDP-N-acetylmuramoyl-L-alanine--D-glutamate ligase [Acidimicrobiales bacterium]
MPENALVVGFGTSGSAVARHLRDRGARVVAIDDAPTDTVRARAAELGIELVDYTGEAGLRSLVKAADVVVPSPGVPLRHPVFRLADDSNVPVRGEVELAFRWTRHPLVAVTGTNGKTSVTALITDMLEASGLRAVAAGNIGLPLSDAVRRDVDIVVAEVSSFQLWWTDTFRPSVAVWLNVAEDHLDWHPDSQSYVAAKARIWARQEKGDTAVINADDPVVTEEAAGAPSRVVTFAMKSEADYRLDASALRAPEGDILPVEQLRRALPHDIANALAASAAARAAGATMEGVRTALQNYSPLPHRLTLVADAAGVRWYDDSKATNPHAALAAIRSFESVVLIAGGRNKGLDLSILAQAANRIRGVVAIGEAAAEVAAAFSGIRPVKPASSMDEATEVAAGLADPGDVVLLSPACASFDRYGSYAERGDDFGRAVRYFLDRRAEG